MSEELTDKLYKTVQEYIEGKGGKVVVIGGVELQSEMFGEMYNYKIAINFTGKPPHPLSIKQ